MEKSINKNNIKRNIAIGALVTTLLAGTTGLVIESNIDHINEYCPFCEVLGMGHQVWAINHYSKYNNYWAEYIGEEIGLYKEVTDATKIESEGIIIYTAPDGYSLEGTKAVRTRYANMENIEIINKSDEQDTKKIGKLKH